MKKELIFVGLISLSLAGNAQAWITSGTAMWNTNPGNVAIGNASPTNKLHVSSSNAGDGIRITQYGTGATGLHFAPSTGHLWSLYTLGSGDGWGGAGDFAIQDATSSSNPRLYIKGSTGNVGIGTYAPTNGRLQIEEDLSTTSFNRGVYATGYSSTGTTWWNAAIEGLAGSVNTTDENYGLRGRSVNGGNGNGGYFSALNNALSSTGIYATASGVGSTWAGYFSGNVYAWNYTSSDRKLKENIRPLANAIDKLKLLKPSIYNYKTGDEYKDMHLPKGSQMGLIAQELEEVFPELIAEVKSMSKKNEKGEVTDNIIDHKSVNYTSLIPLLIAGFQEQQRIIEVQQQRIDALENKSVAATGINGFNSIETGFQMSQNEPNPFTHETVVKYTLPTSVTNAFMAVYDLTGKQITTFPIDQKGSASIVLTSEKLAAGIYIYSIVADGKVMDSKRMIVAEK